MKKLLAIASSFALAFVASVSIPTVARAQGVSEHVDVCQLYVDLGFYSSVGECVRANEIGPVRLCQFLKEEGLFPFDFDDETVELQGECVRWFRQDRKDQ
jgi:hypothetical protein